MCLRGRRQVGSFQLEMPLLPPEEATGAAAHCPAPPWPLQHPQPWPAAQSTASHLRSSTNSAAESMRYNLRVCHLMGWGWSWLGQLHIWNTDTNEILDNLLPSVPSIECERCRHRTVSQPSVERERLLTAFVLAVGGNACNTSHATARRW